jgi:mannose-6-phosphate isomerase class I
MESIKLYPLQFEPILKERIWGGTKLKTFLNKPIISNITGESWEISTIENDVSVVVNGSLKGKSLIELINEFPEAVLGTKVYAQFGKQFPLLFKYLDAREDLSIQLHPNDELAKKRHNFFGKTEMWYVMQADTDARLILGFKEKSSPEEYVKNLNNKTLLTILDTKKVKQGDVITIDLAIDYLMHDLKTFQVAVDSFTTDLVNQNQFDALVSFAYNLGSGALKSSTLLKKVNAKPNDTTIQAEFEKWVYAGNVKLQGLIKRRKSEAFLYYKGQLNYNF